MSCAVDVRYVRSIDLESTLERKDGRRILLNSVSVASDTSLVVADGGNDCVHRLDRDGKQEATFGGCTGSGRRGLKEPVGAFALPDGRVYVMDWHNHRVVVLDSALRYVDAFGRVGRIGGEAGRHRLARYLRLAAHRGTRITEHFGQNASGRAVSRPYDVGLMLRVVKADVSVSGGLRRFFAALRDPGTAIDKPNGAAMLGSRLVVAQKNNRCLSVYHRTPADGLELVRHVEGPEPGTRFGRLGQVADHAGQRLFVCDSEAAAIWEFDERLELVRRFEGLPSGAGFPRFFPFACRPIDGRLLAVCGGFNFQIIDLDAGCVVHISDDLGELHGIDHEPESGLIYVANRSHARILVYELEPRMT